MHTDGGVSLRDVCMYATGTKLERVYEPFETKAQILDMVFQDFVFVLLVFGLALVQSFLTMFLFFLLE